MIEVLDETIKDLLVEKMPLNLAEVDVSFDVPNRDWSGSISKPTINIYLHDIRENLELKHGGEWVTERLRDGQVIKTKLGGRYDLSYLITAWTNNTEDEHRLLWYVLATLVRYPVLPSDVLPEVLRNQPYPLITKIAQPDGVLRNAADVWTALDNQLKPVLPYVVTLALDPHVIRTTTQVRSRFLRFYPPTAETPEEQLGAVDRSQYSANGKAPAGVAQYLQIGGKVTDSTNPDLPIHAQVVLVEQGLDASTDKEGRFKFNNVIDRPQYTLLAVAPGYATLRKTVTMPATSYDLEMQPEAASSS
jgi:hypothetical protein